MKWWEVVVNLQDKWTVIAGEHKILFLNKVFAEVCIRSPQLLLNEKLFNFPEAIDGGNHYSGRILYTVQETNHIIWKQPDDRRRAEYVAFWRSQEILYTREPAPDPSSSFTRVCVTQSNLVLLTPQQASKSGDELLGQGKPADQEDAGLVSQKSNVAWIRIQVSFIVKG